MDLGFLGIFFIMLEVPRLLGMKNILKMYELLIHGHRNILITRVMKIFYTWVMVNGKSLFAIP